MISQPYQLYVERIDAARNMARFYALSIEPTLFGEACLVRRWGRIGSRGRTVIEHYEQEGEAVNAFLDLLRRKRQRGYRTLSAHLVGSTKQPSPPTSNALRA